MFWWIENVVGPYMFFLNEWFEWITVAVLLASSALIGKFFHPKSFDSWEDYLWPVLFITVATVLLPTASVLIMFILPIIAVVMLIAAVGGGIFWAVQNNFWIKRGKK